MYTRGQRNVEGPVCEDRHNLEAGSRQMGKLDQRWWGGLWTRALEHVQPRSLVEITVHHNAQKAFYYPSGSR
jgi:hypothetical protein